MTQTGLFDAGERGKELGIKQAADNASNDFRHRAIEAIYAVARFNEYLTTNEVWDKLEVKPHEPRALGGMMLIAEKAGYIVPTETTRPSTRPSQHRQPIRVWKSLIYHEGERRGDKA